MAGRPERSLSPTDGRRLPTQRPPRKVRRAGDYVASAMKGLGVPSRRMDQRLHQAWDQVCETSWRERTRLRRFDGGVLEVGVSSAPLLQELAAYHADRLRDLLRSSLDGIVLVGLRFVADRDPEGPDSGSPSKRAGNKPHRDTATASDHGANAGESSDGALDAFDFFGDQE